MMGLGLTIGILVDDSIVVLENITRHRDMGESPLDAAYIGRTEIGQAAITITLVDVVVFLPIAFLTGIIGKYMREFGVVIVVATLFSLLVSFTLTPLLAGRWSVKQRSPAVPWWAAWFQNLFERMQSYYVTTRVAVGSCETAFSCRSCAWRWWSGRSRSCRSGSLVRNSSRRPRRACLYGSLTYRVGTPLATTQEGLAKLDKELLKIPNVQAVLSTAGAKRSGFSVLTGGNYAEFNVVLDKAHRRETDAVVAEARKLGWVVPGADYQVASEGGGGSGAEIYYTLKGPDDVLNQAAEKLAALLRAQPGTVNVITSAETAGSAAEYPYRSLAGGAAWRSPRRRGAWPRASRSAARSRPKCGSTRV